jgi:hypothetical protein
MGGVAIHVTDGTGRMTMQISKVVICRITINIDTRCYPFEDFSTDV